MKKNKKEHKISILLIISVIFLIVTIGMFGYSLLMNKNLERDIKKLEGNIRENNELISNNNDKKSKLESEYNKLQEELKDKVDEYNVWERIKEKLVK